MIEIAQLVVNVLTLIVVTAGFLIALRQLKLAVKQIRLATEAHSENHEWERRNAAQNAVSEWTYSQAVSGIQKLQETFGFLDRQNVIPLAELNAIFKNDSELRLLFHRLLGYYEDLGRGVLHGVYNDDIIKAGYGNTMIRLYDCFREYIVDRQRSLNKTAFDQLEGVVIHWKERDRKEGQAQLGHLKRSAQSPGPSS